MASVLVVSSLKAGNTREQEYRVGAVPSVDDIRVVHRNGKPPTFTEKARELLVRSPVYLRLDNALNVAHRHSRDVQVINVRDVF